jgi:hypothetical protein
MDIVGSLHAVAVAQPIEICKIISVKLLTTMPLLCIMQSCKGKGHSPKLLRLTSMEVGGDGRPNIQSEGQCDSRAGELCDSMLFNSFVALFSLLADHAKSSLVASLVS